MRKLATIQKIKDIRPIPNADNIDVATVNGWNVVVKKGLYEVGEKVIYCEVDSFLPIEPEFEFLRKSSFKTLPNGDEGFRLKTIKMRGQVSQGLVIPLEDAQSITERNNCRVDLKLEEVGTDVSNLLGITKYERPIPANLSGVMKGDFPSFIKKTDQERIQNLTEEYEQMKQKTWFVTEKLEGSSATFYLRDGEFGVCSRNIELVESDDNTLWRVARELNVEEKLREFSENGGSDIAIQGEIIGAGVQGNIYKLNSQTIRFFSSFSIENYSYDWPPHYEMLVGGDLGLETVPIIDRNFKLPDTIEELLDYAEGESQLRSGVEREGIVLTNIFDGNDSFKVISNKYLLNEK